MFWALPSLRYLLWLRVNGKVSIIEMFYTDDTQLHITSNGLNVCSDRMEPCIRGVRLWMCRKVSELTGLKN